MTLPLLIQTAVAIAGESDISRIILYSAGALVVGVMGWVIRVTQKVDKTVTRLSDAIFGYTGENGLNSDVKRLREDVDEILQHPSDRRLGPTERRRE